MNTKGALAIVAFLYVAGTHAASKLDTPIEQTRPTVRTEIYRGRVATEACGIETAGMRDCAFAIQNANVQHNTSSDAFNAGLFFAVWLTSSAEEQAMRSVMHKEAGTDALRFYRTMKEYQTKLGIDNKALCEAAKVVCPNVVPTMQEWDRRLR